MMMIIVPNSRAHKGKKERGEVKGEYGGIWREEEGNADYGGVVQPSQQHFAPRVKVLSERRGGKKFQRWDKANIEAPS